MIDYDFHFSGFRGLDFTNCFTGLYMYLEGIQGEDGYDCAKKQGKPCDSCGNCGRTLHGLQERLFFLFDTISGRSATVHGWGGKPTAIYREIYDTDDMIEFVMGYAGYAYEKHTENLMEHVRKSLEGGVPVLARLKTKGPYTDVKVNSFRLIVGYDGGKLQVPAPKGAHKPRPKKAPKPGDIESVYVITGKTERKYTLPDALRRIKRVMDADREAGGWGDYVRAFEGYSQMLRDIAGGNKKAADLDLAALFETACKGLTCNCHNIGNVFHLDAAQGQNWIWDEFNDPRLEECYNRIGPMCHDSWLRQGQVHAIAKIPKQELHGGFYISELAAELMGKLRENDGILYDAVCAMIGILEKEAA